MSDRRKSSLENYTSPSPTPASPSVPQLVKKYPGAETFKGSQKGSYLRLIDKQGNFDMHAYGHIIECTYRDGFFTIVTTSRSYILSGQNLPKIADLIDERKLKALHEYHPQRHQKPDSSAVIIDEISRADE